MQTPQVASLSVLQLIMDSTLIGKLVLLILLLLSVFSWAIIISKIRGIKKVTEQNKLFLEAFWNSKTIDDVFLKSDQFPTSCIASVFKSGFKEFKKIAQEDIHGDVLQNISRALGRSSTQEVAELESHVSWLATIASASPFIGLFGTVWGIMVSFHNIGATGSANLAVVAPGISESLIATAVGLAAAIPAVVFYNHIANRIKGVVIEMDGFSQDFMNLIQRSALESKKGA